MDAEVNVQFTGLADLLESLKLQNCLAYRDGGVGIALSRQQFVDCVTTLKVFALQQSRDSISSVGGNYSDDDDTVQQTVSTRTPEQIADYLVWLADARFKAVPPYTPSGNAARFSSAVGQLLQLLAAFPDHTAGIAGLLWGTSADPGLIAALASTSKQLSQRSGNLKARLTDKGWIWNSALWDQGLLSAYQNAMKSVEAEIRNLKRTWKTSHTRVSTRGSP
jgi:hypothetical protein